MRAVRCKGFGSPDVLSLVANAPIPTILNGNHVLVRVKATAVNRADCAQRKGLYAPPEGATDILGLEACGVVEAVGSNVKDVSVGDRVMALLSGGGYAEYVSVDAGHTLPLPPLMTFAEGAAVTEVFMTAWQCLTFNMKVKAGDFVLIHAGASGVGTAASQLCQKVLGASAIATCSESKMDECAKYAKYVVSRTPESVLLPSPQGTNNIKNNDAAVEKSFIFESKIRRLLGDKPLINAVIDPVFGGGYLEESVNVCALDAEITVLAMMGGATLEKFNASTAFRKRINIKFSTLRSRDDAYKSKLVSSFKEMALPMFDPALDVSKRLVPVIDKVLPIEEVVAAHRLIDASETVGKIVLTF